MADNLMQSSNQTVQSTTQGKEPWGPAQDAMKLGIADATTLYNNKSGFQPFGKSLAIGHSAKTQEGLAGIENSANAFGADLAKPLGFNTGVMNSGGWNTPQFQAMGNLGNLASSGGFNTQSGQGINNLSSINRQMMRSGGLTGAQHEALGGFRDMKDSGGLSALQQQAVGGFQGLAGDGGFSAPQQASLGQIGDIASGSQMQNNPYLEGMIDDVSGDIRESTNRQASAMGRYGSGTHQDVLENNIADASRSMRFADYSNQLGRMDNAIQSQFGMGQTGVGNTTQAYGAIGGFGQQGVGNQAGALGSISNLGQQGFGNMTDSSNTLFGAGNEGFRNTETANQQLFGMGQQGIGNQAAAGDQMASSYNLMQQPYRDLMGVGQMEEDQAAAQLQDELRVHQEAQAEPWDRLLAMQGIATGAGRVGGTSTSNQTVIRPGTSPFQAMVGGGMQAYDQGMDPWMGALAGYLGG